MQNRSSSPKTSIESNVGEEDGEIMEEQEKIQYSLEKLIEWPGFNSPVPEKFRDETGKYRAMSYSAVKSLKVCKLTQNF